MQDVFDPDWVLSPGAILQGELDERHISPRVFAIASGLDIATVNGILSGETRLTLAMATKISTVVGMSSSAWMRLEKMYRDGLKAGKKDVS
jgi:plasmid maintenance system antidote protein VapI